MTGDLVRWKLLLAGHRATNVFPNFSIQSITESIRLRIEIEIHLQSKPEIRRHFENT